MAGPLLLGVLLGYSVGIAVIVVAAIPDTLRGARMAKRYPQKRKPFLADVALMALVAVVWPVFLADKVLHA